MAVAIPIVMAAGALVSAYGAYEQGQNEKKAAEFNAQVESNNAAASTQEAQIQATQDARQTALLKGTIIANAGASGGTGQGSALDVLGDTVSQGTLQEQNDIYTGKLKAMGYTNSATADSLEAHNAQRSSVLNAAGALLGGASQAGSTYARLNPGGQGGSLTQTG